MQDINEVVIVGRLTREAELRYISSGTAVTKFPIAVNRTRKKGETWEDEGHFFDVTLWGRQAEAVTKYLTKGQQIVVKGSLRQNRWTDRDTGNNRSKVEIHADTVQLVGGKRDSNRSSQFGNQPGDTPVPPDEEPENFESDIPF